MTRQRLETWSLVSSQIKRRGHSASDAFTLGTTKPTLTDPWNPTVADNVGAAFGWNGVALTTITGDYTIPANTTMTNTRFQGFVTFTDATSVASNCVFEGRAPGGTFSSGLVKGGSGGTLDRCTLVGTQTSAIYYMDGVESTGGTWTLTRCAITRVVDGVHANGGTVKLYGCQVGPYAFFDNDANHTTDAVHPWWGHGDCMQRLSGLANNDQIIGCSLQGYFDRTGVTLSGGVYANGATTIGNPAAAMNGNGKDTAGNYLGNGSTTAYPGGNYANVITYSNTSPYSGMVVQGNWIDGGAYPSQLIQITTGTGNSITITSNRFGLGGKPGGASSSIFLIGYPSDTAVTQSGNVLDPDNPWVPTALKGQALTFTSTGVKIAGVATP